MCRIIWNNSITHYSGRKFPWVSSPRYRTLSTEPHIPAAGHAGHAGHRLIRSLSKDQPPASSWPEPQYCTAVLLLFADVLVDPQLYFSSIWWCRLLLVVEELPTHFNFLDWSLSNDQLHHPRRHDDAASLEWVTWIFSSTNLSLSTDIPSQHYHYHY